MAAISRVTGMAAFVGYCPAIILPGKGGFRPSFPPPLDRHSRVSGNPDGTEKTSPLPPNRRQIPAYAGMTVESRHYRSNPIQKSCLSMFESFSPR